MANKINYNAKRFKSLCLLRNLNIKLSIEMQKFINNNNNLSEHSKELTKTLCKSLNSCSSHTLLAEGLNNELEFITAFSCKHKLCYICNKDRQKAIRRKYLNWFENNQYLVEMERYNPKLKETETKFATQYQKEKYEKRHWTIIDEKIEYDLMTLTLTVPHTVDGWRGKRFYFREIKAAFNELRKTDEWINFVYGGEYGIENTKNENGYHIHIHALLFVKKMRSNRNMLHRIILRIWNKLTIDSNANREEFTTNDYVAIKKGNRLIYDSWIYNCLDPKGATLVSLETIFYIENKKKKHVYNYNKDTMLHAVMETISYHFKPKMFIEKDGFHDLKAIAEILPQVYKLPLYWKFGILQGETKLTISDNSLLEDYDETSEMVDEETGEVLQKTYFITDPVNCYVNDSQQKIHVKKLQDKRIMVLKANTGREAVKQLIDSVTKNNRHENICIDDK